jgi:hypothetical protein
VKAMDEWCDPSFRVDHAEQELNMIEIASRKLVNVNDIVEIGRA